MKSKAINCPLCGVANESFHWVEEHDTGYSLCKACGIMYTERDKVNNVSSGKNDFRGVYYDPALKGGNTLLEYTIRWWMPRILKELDCKNGEGKTFFEVGFANTVTMDFAKEKGFKTIGMDLNSHPNDSNTGHSIVYANFETAQVSNDTDDIVWASHIFEHFNEPIKALEKFYKMIKSGGLLYLAQPCVEWEYKVHLHPEQHHILWTKEAFLKQAEKVGFKLIADRPPDIRVMAINNDMQLLFRK